MDNKAQVENFSRSVAKIKQEIRKDLVGQDEIVDNVIIAIIAGGNVLLEGVPGVGKTRLVRTLGKALKLPFSRIQFTPDLMPSDVTGTNVIEKDASGKMNTVFQRGPIFANLVLADEINRATPKTQSAMLEVMQEHRVTVANKTYGIAEPFFVLATQNPIEQDGTYPLPEAQMDRFMFKLLVGFPSVKELADIVNMTQITMDETATSVVDGETILGMRELSKSVPVVPDVLYYAMRLVARTHPELPDSGETAKKYIKYGCSPRAGQAIITAAKVRALIEGRFNVSYEDINALAYPVLRHRMKINYAAINEKLTVDDVITKLIAENNHDKGTGKLDKTDKPAADKAATAAPAPEVAPDVTAADSALQPAPDASLANGKDKKAKKVKPEKVKKEKPEKVKKEKPAKVKPEKVKKEKPAKVKPEKPEKVKKDKKGKDGKDGEQPVKIDTNSLTGNK
ncbi:MAG: MoxR family ATPase [Clostridia bacterium]|nr:MoxR family ATPase [Clostridia bacterium]